MEFDAVRDALRQEREARVGSRAKMEERSGVSEGTIYKIETAWVDPRTKKPYVPGADQLLRLVGALPNITVSEFFARIEGLPESRQAATKDRPPNPTGEQQSPPVPSGVDAAFFGKLADACLLAAANSKRSHIQGLLEELAVAFEIADDPTDDRYARAAQRVQAARLRRLG